MGLGAVFLDTSVLLALLNTRDQLHDRASAVFRELRRERRSLVTSEWVLAEYLGSAAPLALRRAAARNVRRLMSSPNVTIVRASSFDWSAALELYEQRADKEWSLVDCLSMRACEDRSIREVLTHDRHFLQAGFEILL